MKAREHILASRSPRRQQLLKQIGLDFQAVPSDLEEPPFTEGKPSQYAKELAVMKTAKVASEHPEAIVIGADTIVVVDKQVLGKPKDADDARSMLTTLSNRPHYVHTGYCMRVDELDIQLSGVEKTKVYFRELNENEIQTYIDTGAPFDKAGAYGIQDYSAIFVDKIKGDYFNVMGFPLAHFIVRYRAFLEQIRS